MKEIVEEMLEMWEDNLVSSGFFIQCLKEKYGNLLSASENEEIAALL